MKNNKDILLVNQPVMEINHFIHNFLLILVAIQNSNSNNNNSCRKIMELMGIIIIQLLMMIVWVQILY